MRQFLDSDFFLENSVARVLYHDIAASLPVVDFHNHLSPADIVNDRNFRNLDEAWLAGDHYKWRAMRANGIEENFVTGETDAEIRFRKWAETVPATARNPLFLWTHLELRRYFGIEQLLTPETSDFIYQQASEMLQQPEFSCRSLLRRMNMETVCTTDDPVDSLQWHQKLENEDGDIRMLPTFRTDRALAFDKPDEFQPYLDLLESASGITISSWNDYLDALRRRHTFFDSMGCRAADNGLTFMPRKPAGGNSTEKMFAEIRAGKLLARNDADQLRYELLLHLAEWHHERDWVQQFHLGALRNPNSRGFEMLGADAGYDTIASPIVLEDVVDFLDELEQKNILPRTILYNLNPVNNAGLATLTGSFGQGNVQWGPAWWFLDHKRGIEEHLNLFSETGLLSRFVGMVTDSRSFLSFPRHEYFRRILCNVIGRDVETGLLPQDFPMLENLISSICHTNAEEWFRLGRETRRQNSGSMK